MTETPEKVADELLDYVRRSLFVMESARLGMKWQVLMFDQYPPPPENPDPLVTFAEAPPTAPSSLENPAWMRQSEVRAAAENDGWAHRLVGQQWVVTTYAMWEDEFRPRLAAALGFEDPDDLKVPVFGDLRHLRHDVVHHGSVATADHAGGKCTVLRWAETGEVIHVTSARTVEFVIELSKTDFRAPG